MRTPAAETDGSLGAAVGDVADHLRSLARLEAELASTEIRARMAPLAAGGVLLASAALAGLFALGFLLAAGAAALALVMPTWAALLIVVGALASVAIATGVTGVRRLRRAEAPVPEHAVREAKLTVDAVKGH